MIQQFQRIERKRKELEEKLRDATPDSPEEQKLREQLKRLERIKKSFCPYRGLFAFREQDATFFFGRKVYTQKLFEAVWKKPLVALIGASGSGKSSIVYAGLIPQLRRQSPSEGEQKWLIAPFRPGKGPFRALSSALMPFLKPDLQKAARLIAINKLSDKLQSGQLVLTDVVKRIRSKYSGSQLLLFVDQFEELYTLCSDENERRRFLDELLKATEGRTAVCVLTMRSDFLDEALSYRPFGAALQDAALLLSSMTREELRETIERPVKAFDVQFEEGLTDRILEDISDQPGNLSFLEFALTKLWQTRKNRMLTRAAYEKIGGVERALVHHADREFKKLDVEEQEQVQRIFIQLVHLGEGREDTRQILTQADVGEKNWQLLMKLADARLVVVSSSEDLPTSSQEGNVGQDVGAPSEGIEIVHEALIQAWQRLQGWIETEREFRTWQEGLRFVSLQWMANNNDEDILLQGAALAEAEEWLKQRKSDFSQDEQSFINASLQYRDREQAEHDAQHQGDLETSKQFAEKQRQRTEEHVKVVKKLRRRLVFASIFAVIVLVAAIGAFYGFRQAAQSAQKAKEQTELARENTVFANRQKERVQQKYDNALRSQSSFLADLARQQRKAWNVTSAILLALEALPKDMSKPDRPYVPEAEGELYKAVMSPRERHILAGHEDVVNYVTWSADGQRVLTASQDNTARIWDAVSGEQLVVLQGHGAAVYQAVWSPDGQRVLTASEDGTARVWDATRGEQLMVLQGHEAAIWHVAWSPDWQHVLTASEDGTARVWKAINGEQTSVLQGHKGWVSHAAWSPDGQHVLTASEDGTARVWKAIDGKQVSVLQGHKGWVSYAVWSPDGQRVITVSEDRTARIWEAASGTQISVLQGHKGWVSHAAWSSDGQRVLSASEDGSSRVWDATNGEELVILQGHEAAIWYAAWSPDNQHVLTVSSDRTACLWNAASGTQIAVLRGHENEVLRAAWSPDGQRVLTASSDNTIRVWDATRGTRSFPNTQALIDYARETTPRKVLTPAQRKRFFLLSDEDVGSGQ